jgi:hypothetical protein
MAETVVQTWRQVRAAPPVWVAWLGPVAWLAKAVKAATLVKVAKVA